MDTIDLDGNSQYWQLTGHKPNYNTKKSSLHLRARNLLNVIYPTLQILEEIPVHIRRSDLVYLDFYIPLKRMCIEIQGEQHYKFVQHYHGSALGFLKHKKRDRDKKEWCEINGINFIELPYNESDELWQNRLEQLKSK